MSDATLALSDSATTPVARLIDGYRLIQLLGEGGMGTVYLAEQQQPVRRIVALKVMRTTLGGSRAAARFDAERQALARLSHPNVAAMYDAGATEAGFPYFVMERVEGAPVVEYCDEQRLTIRQRVELFILICKGVQHAHQKGVIHRDLKSSNVLVANVEGKPVPKIIDFGIAKAIDQPLTDTTAVLTGHGIVGTPGYMSPEALRGDDLDTRTDIYSLGVLLYELIAGARPHATDHLPFGAVIRLVNETEAPLPATVFRALDEATRQTAAAARASDDRAMASALAGDLGWIARRATARDREERYAAAADLAADLTRYLNHEPVVAAPPSLRYRARKFVRRHRAGVAAGVIVFAVILAGIAGTTIGMIRAQRARAEAEAVSKFLSDLLDSASPWNRKTEITVRELLEEAAGKIAHDLKDQPAARAELLQTIGSAEFHLGHLESAEKLLREALRLRLALEGPDSGRVGGILNDLALVRKHQGHLDDAERMLRESVAIRERAYGRMHQAVSRGLFDLATVLSARGKNAEAEDAYRQSLKLRESLLAAGDDQMDAATVALTMNGLGKHLAYVGRLTEAETHIRRSLALRHKAGDRGYAYALSTLALGDVVGKQGRWAEAEVLDREGLEALEKFVDPSDQRVIDARAQLEAAIAAQR